MAYRVETGGRPQRETASGHTDAAAPGARPSRPAAARDTVSWIRALASQWEDEQSRPHGPEFGFDSDRR